MLQTLLRATDEALADIEAEKKLRKTKEVFLLFPLGSQFDHLIKQQLDKLGVYCLVANPATMTADDVKRVAPKGIILSGGPVSVHTDPPPFDGAIFDLGIPTLGICLGFQLWAQHRGHKVEPSARREYGVHAFDVFDPLVGLFLKCGRRVDERRVVTEVLESHGDRIVAGDGLRVLGSTEHAPVAAAVQGHLWGVQFHPEVSDSVDGAKMLENFVFVICDARDRFPAVDVAATKIDMLRHKLSNGERVLLALSGGSDSAIVAYLLRHALTDEFGAARTGQLRAIYIRGIDRPDDEANVQKHFGGLPWLSLQVVDAADAFLQAVAGKRSMHHKRLAMRGVYKQVLEREAHLFDAQYIAQGTLYTDLSESGGGYAQTDVPGAPGTAAVKKAQIKLHHNVDLKFTKPELVPLGDMVKDGARQIGRALGVPEELLLRHPFPGPGLLVRIENKVKKWKLDVARKADGILIEELRSSRLYEQVWQAGARILASRTTVTKGDGAGSGCVIEVFAVTSVNGFTAQVAQLPWEFIRRVSQRMTNEIPEVGRVVYNCSDKPPATIEMG